MRTCNLFKNNLILFPIVIAILSSCIGQSALDESSKIVGWGFQAFGIDLDSGFIAISAGEEHSIGLKQDGTIVTWGRRRWYQGTSYVKNKGLVYHDYSGNFLFIRIILLSGR